VDFITHQDHFVSTLKLQQRHFLPGIIFYQGTVKH